MATELVPPSRATIVRAADPMAVTADQLALIRRTIAADATADELQLFLYDCQRQGVHPLDKLLHFTKRAGKYTPITSIDFMRTRASDTGEYAGSEDALFIASEHAYPLEAHVTVWRLVQGQRCAFTATARWAEYYPGEGKDGFMWRRMPHTMLAKCAEALALRKGFPRQLAGLYAREELDQAAPEEPTVVTPAIVIPANHEPVTDQVTPVAAPPPAAPRLVSDPQDDVVTITKVDPPWPDAKGNVRGWLFHSGMAPTETHGLAMFSTSLVTRAEECCAARTPVRLTIVTSKGSGKSYVKEIAIVLPEITDDDSPF